MYLNNTVLVDDSKVIVSASEFIKHDGYTHRLNGMVRMLYNLSTDLVDKKLVFRFNDGEPIKIVAFCKIVSDITAMLGLDQTKIVFELVDHVPRTDTPFQVILRHSGFFSLAKKLVRSDLCILEKKYLMFGAFFGRFTLHRMLIAYHLETQISYDSLVGFQPEYKWAEYEIGPLQCHFHKQMDWLKSRQYRNTTLDHTFNGCVKADDCLPVYHEIFGQYAVEIVIETNVYDMGSFTEKTTKCLVAGKPFLLFGTPGQLQKLRDMGFRTFDGIINERYDLEPNLEKRFDMICAEINRLAGLSPCKKSSVVDELYKISEFNKANYKEIIDRYYRQELV